MLYESNNSITENEKEDFNFTAKIPEDIIDPTAIGSIIANYYVISVKAKTSGISGNCRGDLHIVISTNNPVFEEKKNIQIPQNWNPMLFDLVKDHNLPPFIHKPSEKIIVQNLSPE